MSTAYTAHVTLHNGDVHRVDVPAQDGAKNKIHAGALAMTKFGGRARSVDCWPVERQVRTLDCRVSLSTPVKHSDSEFGELQA